MIFRKMLKIIIFSLSINLFATINVLANNNDFNLWLIDFKIRAVNSGISNLIVDEIMSNAKFLPKVIQYDRYQFRQLCRRRLGQFV